MSLYPKLEKNEAIQLILCLMPSNLKLKLVQNKIWLVYLFDTSPNSLNGLETRLPKENLLLYSISTELVNTIQKMNLLVNRSKYP
ncbi:MAG: hypothetical protein ACC656_02770 [Candidatus Heimdallarchaeota archaeon]